VNEDRFASPVVFPTGVRWEPTDYKSIDQTPYLDYLDREEEKVRAFQKAAGRDDDYSPAAMARVADAED
jgi:hypothetical protein